FATVTSCRMHEPSSATAQASTKTAGSRNLGSRTCPAMKSPSHTTATAVMTSSKTTPRTSHCRLDRVFESCSSRTAVAFNRIGRSSFASCSASFAFRSSRSIRISLPLLRSDGGELVLEPSLDPVDPGADVRDRDPEDLCDLRVAVAFQVQDDERTAHLVELR